MAQQSIKSPIGISVFCELDQTRPRNETTLFLDLQKGRDVQAEATLIKANTKQIVLPNNTIIRGRPMLLHRKRRKKR